MKRRSWNTTIVALAALLAAATANATIMSGDERAQKLEQIRELLAGEVRPVTTDDLAKAPSPFAADLGIKVEKKERTVTLSDEAMLAELAKYVNPTGTFVFGGETYLVFNETRAKAGSDIVVTYNNKEYSITIAEITRLGYTIKFGDSELQLKLK